MSLYAPPLDRPSPAAPVERDAVPAGGSEKPVFAATGSARPRALRLVGRAAAGLVGLWLVALVLGAFGFGHVPGLQLPRVFGNHEKAAGASDQAKSAHKTPASTVLPTAGHEATPELRTPIGAPVGPGRRGSRTGPGQGGSSGRSGTGTGSGTAASPAPAPSASATPSTTAPSATHSHNSNSQAQPHTSSSSSPGSHAQATTAPGRQHSTAAPGSGKTEHGRPLKP